MGKYETIKQLITVWEAAKNMAGPYRLRAENYADGYADGLKAALALYEEPPNQENTTDACDHEWETMPGKIKFVEKCAICDEERR